MSGWLLPQAVERHLVYLPDWPTRMRLRMHPRRPVSRAGWLHCRQLLYSFQEGAQMELGDVLAGGWCPALDFLFADRDTGHDSRPVVRLSTGLVAKSGPDILVSRRLGLRPLDLRPVSVLPRHWIDRGLDHVLRIAVPPPLFDGTILQVFQVAPGPGFCWRSALLASTFATADGSYLKDLKV